jgi:hypothetical protein
VSHPVAMQLARQTPVPQMGQAAAPARGALCRLGYGVVPFGNRGGLRVRSQSASGTGAGGRDICPRMASSMEML